MAAKVLKGEAKASEMNFEVIKGASFYGNTKVAENLGITLPESLTANAAEMFDEITLVTITCTLCAQVTVLRTDGEKPAPRAFHLRRH